MTVVKTYIEAEEALKHYVPLTKELVGVDIRLDRIEELMTVLGSPQKKLKIVHVAGTSGKTSTCYFVASMLQAAGKKVGLTVSPHVDTLRERVQINLVPISEDDFVEAFNEFVAIVESAHLEPSYFEFLVAFAYWYFARQEVDYAVIETGMGGTYDGTNVAKNPDKICVITDIGLDHMHVLGTSIGDIARNKAGIIHSGNQVFMLGQPQDATESIDMRCAEVGAEMHVLGEQVVEGELPDYQQRNWSLAHQVFEYVRERDTLEAVNLEKTKDLQVPARMDAVHVGDRTVIMDGAHNEQKMQAFVYSFRAKYPEAKVPVLLALKRGKEFAAVLPLLKPITSRLIVTNFSTSQDLPLTSIDAGELAKAAENFGFSDVVAEPNKNAAYQLLLDSSAEVSLITGSFYLIGQLRAEHSELVQNHSR